MIFGVRANFLKDFPLELLLSPRRRAKAIIRAMTRRADTSRSKSNIGSVLIRLQLEQRRSIPEAIGNEDIPSFLKLSEKSPAVKG